MLRIDFSLNRFKRLINYDKTFDIILILLNLYFNLMRKRYKYLKVYIK